jgi:hypothetical protein
MSSTTLVQQRLCKDVKLKKPYAYGPYNVVRGDRQAIRITEGCVNNCPQCYEPTQLKIFGIPEIVKNDVLIFDMNLLCKPEALKLIEQLGAKRVGEKVVKYELVCGIDFRFLNQDLANALYKNRFVRMRLAWDTPYADQKRIKKALDMLLKAGYQRKDIMVFMLCNHKRVSYTENCKKLDLCKVWNVKACDCYYDGLVMPHVIPIGWAMEQIISFRSKVRKHNQIVNFGIDPEVD